MERSAPQTQRAAAPSRAFLQGWRPRRTSVSKPAPAGGAPERFRPVWHPPSNAPRPCAPAVRGASAARRSGHGPAAVQVLSRPRQPKTKGFCGFRLAGHVVTWFSVVRFYRQPSRRILFFKDCWTTGPCRQINHLAPDQEVTGLDQPPGGPPLRDQRQALRAARRLGSVPPYARKSVAQASAFACVEKRRELSCNKGPLAKRTRQRPSRALLTSGNPGFMVVCLGSRSKAAR